MFVCGQCGAVTQPGEKATRVVTKTRDKQYPGGSHGWEIVAEALVCESCAAGKA